MNRNELVDASRQRAHEWFSKNYSDEALANLGIRDRNHVEDLIASVMMTRDDIMQGGSFVQAIVANDLESAIARGDYDAIRSLKILVQAKLSCLIKS